MENYKAMYYKLFSETQKAIEILQQAHIDCEEIFIDQDESIETE